MKLSTDKVVFVKINGTSNLVVVDSALFDDIFIEAATRIVDKNKKNPNFFHKMKIIAECYEKKDEKNIKRHYQINMYHILVNSGVFRIAELLREKTINLHKVDLKLEPARANAGKSANSE